MYLEKSLKVSWLRTGRCNQTQKREKRIDRTNRKFGQPVSIDLMSSLTEEGEKGSNRGLAPVAQPIGVVAGWWPYVEILLDGGKKVWAKYCRAEINAG